MTEGIIRVWRVSVLVLSKHGGGYAHGGAASVVTQVETNVSARSFMVGEVDNVTCCKGQKAKLEGGMKGGEHRCLLYSTCKQVDP